MFLFLVIFFISVKGIFASGEFNVSQNITYSVDITGNAKVSHEVNLTNNYSQIYAKEYQIKLSGSSISNVTGNDNSGNIVDNIQASADATTINLKFKDPSIGKDQIHKFVLNYNITDFAKKKGNTWEIQLPSYNDIQNKKTSVILEVPSIFGEISTSSVPSIATHEYGDITQLNFSPTDDSKKIIFVFGKHQLFDFTLKYFLNNSKNEPVTANIAIPPDTNYQNIILKSIDPTPENILTDEDGNWIAKYTLKPAESINIVVDGQAKIHLPKQNQVSINPQKYITSQNFWPTTSPEILAISQNLATVKDIYKYVVNTLDYNFEGLNASQRKGALVALSNPSSSLCTEFTDLFVTLARSKQIPSREIEGYAFSNNSKIKPVNINSDVLHAWPEFYDSKSQTWIQVDPTWEKTTNGIDYFSDLDLNHITFVIHGLSSDSPSPAGAYRDPTNTKTVFVDFASTEVKPALLQPILKIENNKLSVKNNNLFSLNNFKVNQYSTPVIPPLSTTYYPLTSSFSKFYTFNISFNETASPIIEKITNRTYYLYLSIGIGLSIFMLCLGGIIITASSKTHEKNS